jgi:hypothetical protein
MSCFGAPRGPPNFPSGAAPCPSGWGHENRSSLSRASSPWCSTACGVTEWSSASNTLRHDDQPCERTKSAAGRGGCCPCRDERRRPQRSFCRCTDRLRSGHGGAELLTRCCGQPRDCEENGGSGSAQRPPHDHAARRQNSIQRFVRCCLVGPTTSSLAPRATAKGGCGLDLAVPTRPLASERSTPKCADIVGSIALKEETTCLLNRD